MIKGLTDRGMSFPEIGQIRKGDKGGTNGAPRDLQWFRVEFDSREKKAADDFLAGNGPQPTEIAVMLPFDEIERVWDAFLEAYTAGRMVARSDGERYLYRIDPATGKVMCKNGVPFTPYVEGEVLGTWKNSKTGKVENIVCKPVGRMKVVLPLLMRFAYMTVLTGSIHDIANLSGQLAALKEINGGRLAGIPLMLRRRPKKISVPKADGTRARYEKWMLSIEADPSWVKAKLLEVKHLALPGNGLALLPETIDGENQKPEDIQEGEIYEDPESEEHLDSVGEQEPEPEHKAEITLTQEVIDSEKTSKGARYVDLESPVLMGMIEAMNNPKSTLTAQEKARKVAVIDAILAVRQAAEV